MKVCLNVLNKIVQIQSIIDKEDRPDEEDMADKEDRADEVQAEEDEGELVGIQTLYYKVRAPGW